MNRPNIRLPAAHPVLRSPSPRALVIRPTMPPKASRTPPRPSIGRWPRARSVSSTRRFARRTHRSNWSVRSAPSTSCSFRPRSAAGSTASLSRSATGSRENDPLIEVDRETFAIYLAQAEANVEAARADLALAGKDLDRKNDLRSDETIPQAALDQAQAGFDLAKARLAAAEAARNLAARNDERSVIRAPAAGVITERMVVAGQWADVGASLLELAIGEKVKIAARVPESWVGQLHRARELRVHRRNRARRSTRPRSTACSPWSARPAGHSRSSAPHRTTAPCVPGMFANVTLTSPESERTLWLPASAVATSDLPQVLMVENDTIVYRKIQIGRRDNGTIEIVNGLSEGEQVIEGRRRPDPRPAGEGHRLRKNECNCFNSQFLILNS